MPGASVERAERRAFVAEGKLCVRRCEGGKGPGVSGDWLRVHASESKPSVLSIVDKSVEPQLIRR